MPGTKGRLTTSTSPGRQDDLRRQDTISLQQVQQGMNDTKETVIETFTDVKRSVLHLAGNFEAMKSLCENYGLAAALILTMAFANYSSLDSKAWTDYKGVWITSKYCQDFAIQSCNSTIQVTSQLRLGGVGVRQSDWTQGAEFYCTDVFDELTKDGGNPFLRIKGTERECCSETIRCAMVSGWNLELGFIIGNGAGSMLLLMTVLYATLLHIVVQGTRADLTNPVQVTTVQENLEVPFLFLHLLFFTGLGLAFFGIISVMSIRISTPNFSETSYGIGVTAGVLAVILTAVSFFHVLKVNRKISVIYPVPKKGGETKPQEKKPKDAAKDAAAINAIFDKVVQEKVTKAYQARFDKKVQEEVDKKLKALGDLNQPEEKPLGQLESKPLGQLESKPLDKFGA